MHCPHCAADCALHTFTNGRGPVGATRWQCSGCPAHGRIEAGVTLTYHYDRPDLPPVVSGGHTPSATAQTVSAGPGGI